MTDMEARDCLSTLANPILSSIIPLHPRTSKIMTGTDVCAIKRRHPRVRRGTRALNTLMQPRLWRITAIIASIQAQRHPLRALTCTLLPRHHLRIRMPRPMTPRLLHLQIRVVPGPVPALLSQDIIPTMPPSNLHDIVYYRPRRTWDPEGVGSSPR